WTVRSPSGFRISRITMRAITLAMRRAGTVPASSRAGMSGNSRRIASSASRIWVVICWSLSGGSPPGHRSTTSSAWTPDHPSLGGVVILVRLRLPGPLRLLGLEVLGADGDANRDHVAREQDAPVDVDRAIEVGSDLRHNYLQINGWWGVAWGTGEASPTPRPTSCQAARTRAANDRFAFLSTGRYAAAPCTHHRIGSVVVYSPTARPG